MIDPSDTGQQAEEAVLSLFLCETCSSIVNVGILVVNSKVGYDIVGEILDLKWTKQTND